MSDYQSMTWDELALEERKSLRSPVNTTACPECGSRIGEPCRDDDAPRQWPSKDWWHIARREARKAQILDARRARLAREDFGDR